MFTTLIIKNRMEKIAEQYAGKPLRLLVSMPDGRQKEMSTTEAIAQRPTVFRVISGNSLSDLDKILEYGYSEAFL